VSTGATLIAGTIVAINLVAQRSLAQIPSRCTTSPSFS